MNLLASPSGQNREIIGFFSEIELEWSRQFHAKASEQDPVTGQMYTDLMNDLLSLDLHSRIYFFIGNFR